MKTQLTLTLVSILAAQVCIADCLYGDCNEGLGIQTTTGKGMSVDIGFSAKALSLESSPILSKSNETYVGDFMDGKKTGCATITSDDSVYFGQVENSKRHGFGTLSYTKLLKRKTWITKVKEGRWENNRFKESMTIELDGLCPQVSL